MKKFASLLLTVVLLTTMLTVFAVPASAEEEPTEIEPKNDSIEIFTAGNYIIRGEYVVRDIQIIESDATLTIAKGATVTVTTNFDISGTINVYGTLNLTDTINRVSDGTIRIMGCIGGKFEGTVNGPGTVNTYNEHNFENDKCTYCGTCKCEITGKHTFVDGKCVCGTYECMGVAKHNWVNGVCSACNVKGCEIGQLNHNWVNGVCSVCNTPCEHKWDANTGKCTVCEYVCPHDGNTCVECGANIHGGEIVQNLGLGSVLSEGSLTIIVGIACLAIGFLAAMFIFKKKKPAVADEE